MAEDIEIQRKKDRERRRKRYAEDPAYRARQIAGGRAWKKANQEKVNANSRRKYAEDPTRELLRRYGITNADYEAMLARQNGVCAICKSKRPGEKLCVDHCHICKKVRRLLCGGCNLGLGHYKHNPELTGAATNYLKEFSCDRCCPTVPIPRRAKCGTKRNQARTPVSSPTLPTPEVPAGPLKSKPKGEGKKQG
jgi:hypothetical protein